MLVDNTRNSTKKFKVITTEVVYLMEEHQLNIAYPNTNSVLLHSRIKEEVYQESQRDSTTSTGSQTWHERLTWTGIKFYVKETCKFGICVLNSLAVVGWWLLDTIINFCTNEHVHNVIYVFGSVSLELLVVLVLAIATVFTSIIINIDECYRNYTSKQRFSDRKVEHDMVVSTVSDLKKAEKLYEEVLKEQRLKLSEEVPKLKALLAKSVSDQEQEINCMNITSTQQSVEIVKDDISDVLSDITTNCSLKSDDVKNG